MNALELIQTARLQGHVTSNQISDAQALTYLNLVKDNFWSTLVSYVGEDFNWERWTTTLVASQGEYQIPEVASDQSGAKKLREVSIAYDSETYNTTGTLKYQRAKEVDPMSLPYDWSWYEENQPEETPLYFVAENSIFLAPIPQTTINFGIRLRGIRKIADYTINGVWGETVTTAEADMRIPVDYFDTLIQGILPYFYRQQGKINEANAEKSEYERMSRESAKKLSDRVVSPFYAVFPDDRFDNSIDGIEYMLNINNG